MMLARRQQIIMEINVFIVVFWRVIEIGLMILLLLQYDTLIDDTFG